MHRPAARHADRAFVRRAVHPQHPREVVLVADAGAFPSATAAMRAGAAKLGLSAPQAGRLPRPVSASSTGSVTKTGPDWWVVYPAGILSARLWPVSVT